MASFSNIEKLNKEFWEELCGTTMAKRLGIIDDTLQSLRLFDNEHLRFYPYLLNRIPASSFSGMRVLEVGLGYGTLGQLIFEAGADYYGLDIANGSARSLKFGVKARMGCPRKYASLSIRR